MFNISQEQFYNVDQYNLLISAGTQVFGWVFGPFLCDMWTCGDVLCCTASILHLLAIALDRSDIATMIYK